MIDAQARPLARMAQVVIVAILVGIGISHVVFAIRDWPLGDMDVYLAAAQRLLDGEPLYLPGDIAANSYWDVAVSSYWYAPWYAAAWIPLTLLPRDVVAVAWSAALLAATAGVVALLCGYGRRGAALALLVGPVLFAVSAGGNIQSLMVLALLVGFHRNWGPLAVAAAASMKFAPILLAVAYAARGEWFRAFLSVGLAALLLLPALLMGITGAGVQSNTAPSLLGVSPVLYVLAVVGSLIAVGFAPRRHRILAATAAAVLALPRLFIYDVTLVAVGASRPTPERDSQSTTSG